MPLIKAADSSYHGITTSTPHGKVKFSPKGYALVTETQKLFFQNEFTTFVLIDQDFNAEPNEGTPTTEGVFEGDDLIKVTSKGPNEPSLRNQLTSTTLGRVWFNSHGIAYVPSDYADFFKQMPGSFHVEGVEPDTDKKTEAVVPAVDETKEKLDAIRRKSNKIIDEKSESDARKSTAPIAVIAEEAPQVYSKTNNDGTPDLTPEGAGMSEREKDLRGKPLTIVKQEAMKAGIENPYGQTKEELIKAILARQ